MTIFCRHFRLSLILSALLNVLRKHFFHILATQILRYEFLLWREQEVRWDRVHGKKRKAFKYVLKQAKKEVFKQFDVWNKYCGRDDVLYIHCRLGAGNWNYYKGWEIIESQPWFLDKCEDYFTSPIFAYMSRYVQSK